MAKVKLINTREHAIHLTAPHNPKSNLPGGRLTIPMAKQDPDDRSKLIHGEAVADSDFLAEVKQSPVVQHYFKEGWLRAVGSDRPAEEKPEIKK